MRQNNILPNSNQVIDCYAAELVKKLTSTKVNFNDYAKKLIWEAYGLELYSILVLRYGNYMWEIFVKILVR